MWKLSIKFKGAKSTEKAILYNQHYGRFLPFLLLNQNRLQNIPLFIVNFIVPILAKFWRKLGWRILTKVTERNNAFQTALRMKQMEKRSLFTFIFLVYEIIFKTQKHHLSFQVSILWIKFRHKYPRIAVKSRFNRKWSENSQKNWIVLRHASRPQMLRPISIWFSYLT